MLVRPVEVCSYTHQMATGVANESAEPLRHQDLHHGAAHGHQVIDSYEINDGHKQINHEKVNHEKVNHEVSSMACCDAASECGPNHCSGILATIHSVSLPVALTKLSSAWLPLLLTQSVTTPSDNPPPK